MRVALFVLLAACESGDVLPALAPPQADVEVWLVQAKVASGEPAMVTVQTTAAEGWSFQPIVPYADDLEVSLVAESEPVTVNDRQVVSRQYAMSGPDGSYVISTTEGEATGPGGQSRTFESVPLFADIGVDGPTGGPMDGFATAAEIAAESSSKRKKKKMHTVSIVSNAQATKGSSIRRRKLVAAAAM